MRMTSIQFIHPESHLWQECLAEMPHDFYHMPGYLRLCAECEGGSRKPSWPAMASTASSSR